MDFLTGTSRDLRHSVIEPGGGQLEGILNCSDNDFAGSCKVFPDYLAMHIGQPHVAAAETIGQPFVVESQKVKHATERPAPCTRWLA